MKTCKYQECYEQAIRHFKHKIVVLDDDPTGIQTVHDVFVYTRWDKESIMEAFQEDSQIFFILTNSRGLVAGESEKIHREIAQNVVDTAKELGVKFMLISRSDSTLRGHYPLETEVLRQVLEENGVSVDGEIIAPVFVEGGRLTIDDVHYIQEGEQLIPVGESEFALDWTFGYKNSNLKKWIEEKSNGEFPAETVRSVTLDELAKVQIESIVQTLASLNDFQKIILNAKSYNDIKIFAVALIEVMNAGKNYIARSAAGLTKVLGGVKDKELLTPKDLNLGDAPGVIIIGSHVKKTTAQLEKLKEKMPHLTYLEFNVHLVLDPLAFQNEQERVKKALSTSLEKGESVVVFTSRQDFEVGSEDKEDELRVAVQISNAVTDLVSSLKTRPGYMIAKGGITSSDVGTKGLAVRKALVGGQVLPGVPVWIIGEESRFPDMPYIIFPGNVGSEMALAEVVQMLEGGE